MSRISIYVIKEITSSFLFIFSLLPWNTCGAYQSSILGVSVADYFIYAIF